MFSDTIRAGVQFQNIDGQPNQVLLQLWKQLPNSQRFQHSPKREGIRPIEWIPQNTWNLEDFIVPSKKHKPPQVAWTASVEPSEENDLGIVDGETEKPQFPKSRVSRGDWRPYVELTIHWS